MFRMRHIFPRATATRRESSNRGQDGPVVEGEFMKKAMLVSVAVMVCAAMAFAQETPSGGAAGQNGSQTPSATQTTTGETSGNAIQGCLTGSSGNYVLTDSSGVAYKVKGDESQLADYVNKEVEVMGTTGSSAAASAEHAGQTAGETAGQAAGQAGGEAGHAAGEAAGEATGEHGKTVEVSSVKKLADSCSMNK
jgi:hypothetical protein